MRAQACTSAALALALGATVAFSIEPGSKLTDPHLTPWTARLVIGAAAVSSGGSAQSSIGSTCGASLIDEHWLITARHCVDYFCGFSDPGLLGSLEVTMLGKKATFPVMAVACPARSQSGMSWWSDVALLKVQYVRVAEGKLPTLGKLDMTPGNDDASKRLVSVGWSNGMGGHLDLPEAIGLTSLSQTTGAARLAAPGACLEGLTLGPSQFVAVAPTPPPAPPFYGLQSGDSGGPLVRSAKPRPEIVAVASQACSNNGMPIFEDLYDHRCWVAETACDFYCKEKYRQACWSRLLGSFGGSCSYPDGPGPEACKRSWLPWVH
jgi:hypothetical protein